MTIFLTSDQHFSHSNIIKYSSRPYSNIDEMNSDLIERFNARVGQDDLTYHLGDFALREKVVPEILPQLNGSHILIPGNHCGCHPAHKSHNGKPASVEAATKRYLGYGFKEIHLALQLGEFYCTHMPYSDAEDPRYPQYRPEKQDCVLLHGHIHERHKYKDRQLNVGVDVWDWAPVSLDEIRAFLATNPTNC